MTSTQFIDDAIKKNREYLDRGIKAAVNVPEDILNRRPMSGEWSPAQIFSHLVLAHQAYVPLMEAAAQSLPVDAANQEPEPTAFGRWLAKQAGPGTNAPPPKPFIPPDGVLPLKIVEEWGAMQIKLIDILEKAKHRDLNKKFMRNSVLKLFRMNFTDCVLLLTGHTQRHIEQIEERIAQSC